MSFCGRRFPRSVLWPALGLLIVACESGPSGPGYIDGSVLADGSAPGSALLLVSGRGVIDVEGTGGTLGWSDTGGENQIRALLVDPGPGGALTFRVRMEDVGGPLPQVAVLQLADRNDRRFSSADVQVRLQR